MSTTISILPQLPAEITRRLQPVPALIGITAVRQPTFAIYTLGCKVNQYDSHQIARTLLQRGFRRVEFRESADLYVIDTCTVTSEADRKSRKAAGRALRNNPDALVAVTGCAAAYDAGQFERVAPGALVLDNSRKLELPELALQALRERPDWNEKYAQLREQTASEPIANATRERAVLKIQDGCNHRCAFCIIPTVRGASVTKTAKTIIEEARTFVSEGARELIVTGVSMGDWGHTANTSGDGSTRGSRGNGELCRLLRTLAKTPGLERLRVSSLDPADVDEEFLQTVAHTPGICPHIHLALQGGAATTLRRMRRRYTPELFLKWAKRWREIRPDGGLTTDIIVGFPGETAEEFEESLHIAREARFSAIHVFPYSPREGTVAADSPGLIAPPEQKRRVDDLLSLASKLSSEYSGQFIGQTIQVLVETLDADGVADGLTPQYVRARFRPSSQLQIGDVVNARAVKWRDGVLWCESR